MEAQLENLNQISEVSMRPRVRFFALFKRAHLHHRFGDRELKIILDGNDAVHWGDPINDALMFKLRIMTEEEDGDIYKMLYGLT